MQILPEALQPVDLVPMLVAVVLGGLIGFEREVHGRPAGLRTHILVCLTSTLMIYASKRVPPILFPGSEIARIVYDPNRLAAGIMTGIGFLGAATVVRAGDIVRGITTGATVWSVAGVGIVIGQGEYGIAVTGTALLLAVLVGLDRVSRRIAPVIYRRMIVHARGRPVLEVSERVGEILRQNSIRVMDLSGKRGAPDAPYELVFHIRARDVFAAPQMMELVGAQEGVTSVEWSQLAH